MSRVSRIEKLKKLVEEIERENNTQELTALATYLDTFRQKIMVRAMSLRAYGNGDNSSLGRPVPDYQVRGSRFCVDRDWDLLVADRRMDDRRSRACAQTKARSMLALILTLRESRIDVNALRPEPEVPAQKLPPGNGIQYASIFVPFSLSLVPFSQNTKERDHADQGDPRTAEDSHHLGFTQQMKPRDLARRRAYS